MGKRNAAKRNKNGVPSVVGVSKKPRDAEQETLPGNGEKALGNHLDTSVKGKVGVPRQINNLHSFSVISMSRERKTRGSTEEPWL